MSSGIAETVGTPNPSDSTFADPSKCYIEFFNLLHIFGFEVKRDKQPKTPVLVGLQFVLTSGLNQNVAEKLTGEVQDLLMNPHSNIRHVFFDWCRLALSVYEEYSDWNERGNLNVARRETGEVKMDMEELHSPSALARQDAFRFLPNEEFQLEFPSSP